MSVTDEVLHVILDVLAGRQNLPPHAADELHDKITPGYTASLKPLPSAEQIAAARAVLSQGQPITNQPVTVPDPRDEEIARLRQLVAAAEGELP